jgi:biopolymer transport protein ExbD
MSRKSKRSDSTSTDINLAPFMNMVVILIPLLLLSVVFVHVGVFNVSTDLMTPDTPPESDTEEAKRIGLAIGASGARVTVDGEVVAPIDGCASTGPTVCLEKDPTEIRETFARIRKAAKDSDEQRVQALVDEAMQAYDFRSIYNVLADVKDEHPDEERLIITADPDVPYAVLVRAMDVARYRLEKREYREDSTFWAAAAQRKQPMFMDAVFAIAK